jgi:hypothetical protein
MMKLQQWRSVILGVIGAALAHCAGAAATDAGKCVDKKNTDEEWRAMQSWCEQGARAGDPLSQVAVAIHLLDSTDPAGRLRADGLLRSAAAQGYDDANAVLGFSQMDTRYIDESQIDTQKVLHDLEQANGSGPKGLMGLLFAAEMRFNGAGVPADFEAARATFKRATEAVVNNANRGIPVPGDTDPFSEWVAGIMMVERFGPRYGYQVETVNGVAVLRETAPQPGMSLQELVRRSYGGNNAPQPGSQ